MCMCDLRSCFAAEGSGPGAWTHSSGVWGKLEQPLSAGAQTEPRSCWREKYCLVPLDSSTGTNSNLMFYLENLREQTIKWDSTQHFA